MAPPSKVVCLRAFNQDLALKKKQFPTPPPPPKRIAWPGGKISSNKDEALVSFLRRKLDQGEALTSGQVSMLHKMAGDASAAGVEEAMNARLRTGGGVKRKAVSFAGLAYSRDEGGEARWLLRRLEEKVPTKNPRATVVIEEMVPTLRCARSTLDSKLAMGASSLAGDEDSSNSVLLPTLSKPASWVRAARVVSDGRGGFSLSRTPAAITSGKLVTFDDVPNSTSLRVRPEQEDTADVVFMGSAPSGPDLRAEVVTNTSAVEQHIDASSQVLEEEERHDEPPIDREALAAGNGNAKDDTKFTMCLSSYFTGSEEADARSGIANTTVERDSPEFSLAASAPLTSRREATIVEEPSSNAASDDDMKFTMSLGGYFAANEGRVSSGPEPKEHEIHRGAPVPITATNRASPAAQPVGAKRPRGNATRSNGGVHGGVRQSVAAGRKHANYDAGTAAGVAKFPRKQSTAESARKSCSADASKGKARMSKRLRLERSLEDILNGGLAASRS